VVEQVFYGPPEPTFLVDTDPYFQRRPHMLPPPAYYPRGVDPAYRTRALVAPSGTQTHVVPGNRSVDKVRSHPKVWHRLAVYIQCFNPMFIISSFVSYRSFTVIGNRQLNYRVFWFCRV
jgi:hypothetical protein